MPYIEAAFAGTAAELPPIVYDPSPNVTAPGPRNDRWVRAFIYPVKDDAGQVQEVFLMHEDVTKRIEAEKTARVLEKISKICLQAQTQDHLLSKILEQLLVEFDCERAWLLFPCDPTTPSWRIPYEAARPGWPGANASGEEFPLNPVIAEMFEQCLHSDNALTLETGEVPVDDDDLQKTYTILSQMHMALKPKFGQPWALGLHYCAKRHRFSAHERQLFTEIGHRVAETLGTLLTLRNLAESQSSLSEAQRIAKLGNWELDPLTHELKWSDETYRIFGLTKTQFDVSYKAFLEACHPDDVALVTKTYEESLRDRTTYDLIHRVTTPEGSTKYVHERGETRYDAQGNALKTVGTVQDVTARVLAEEKLRLSSVVVENTGEAIMITDTRHKIVSVNRAFENITGYQTTEVLGKNPNMLIKSDYHDAAFFNALSQQVRATGTWQGEIWNRRNNGEAFPAWSTVTAVRDAMGNATNYVTVFSDISSIKQSQARLDYLAYHDPLTALPNRLLLNDRIEHALQRAAREERQVGVLFLDLDHFKTINDSLGHPVGDRLLKQVARRIKGLVREEDTVSRLGGDEFIILLEDVDDTRTLGKLAQKIIESFREPFSIEPHELQLGVSVGISVYPRDGSDGATLIKNADAAMYRAKEEGRNDYQFYTTELTTAAFERLTLETALRQALKREELVLHYQPQYALATGKLLGAEALIRWRHEELGLISPDKFISVAEESGLISSIGEWVLHHACVQLRHWHAAGLPIGTIAVNVSGKQFQRGRFADVVKSALDASGLAAHHLELELTESAIMQEAERGVNVLHELNDLGVTIAIDDFGTGYSSLSYLKNLPVHKLKIDRSFVRDIPQDANDEAITRAVIALGHSLQLAVLAEGVETKEQQAFLKTQGCHEAQGFLYSKPIGAGDFPALLH
jgi:diguanylate cyclase (GGDEF)-like protein/PAS domain S-box-containing protein